MWSEEVSLWMNLDPYVAVWGGGKVGRVTITAPGTQNPVQSLRSKHVLELWFLYPSWKAENELEPL